MIELQDEIHISCDSYSTSATKNKKFQWFSKFPHQFSNGPGLREPLEEPAVRVHQMSAEGFRDAAKRHCGTFGIFEAVPEATGRLGLGTGGEEDQPGEEGAEVGVEAGSGRGGHPEA